MAAMPPPENENTIDALIDSFLENIPVIDLANLGYALQQELHITQEIDLFRSQQGWGSTLMTFLELDPDERLLVAVQAGSLLLIKLALDNEANIDITYSNEGRTMLHLAAERGNVNVVQYFLEGEGFNIEARTQFGDTPLHAAVATEHVDVVRLLLQRGANPNAINLGRLTPLHLAARGDSAEIVNLLIQYNADRYARDQDARTPQDHARNRAQLNLEIIRLLELEPIPQLSPELQQLYRNAINRLDQLLEGVRVIHTQPSSGI